MSTFAEIQSEYAARLADMVELFELRVENLLHPEVEDQISDHRQAVLASTLARYGVGRGLVTFWLNAAAHYATALIEAAEDQGEDLVREVVGGVRKAASTTLDISDQAFTLRSVMEPQPDPDRAEEKPAADRAYGGPQPSVVRVDYDPACGHGTLVFRGADGTEYEVPCTVKPRGT